MGSCKEEVGLLFNADSETMFPLQGLQEADPKWKRLYRSPTYPEEHQHNMESPNLQAPLNYSTASKLSAISSSPIDSQHSVHKRIVYAPESAPQGLGLTPGIASYEISGPGNEFNSSIGSMDDFKLDFSLLKTNGFVGKYKTIPRLVSHLRNLILSK